MFLSICSLPEFWAVCHAVTARTAGFTWLQTYYAYIFLHTLLTLSISSCSEFPSAFTSKPKIPRTPEVQSASPRKGKVPAIAPQFSQSGPQQTSRPNSSGSSTRSRQSKWKKSSFCLSVLGWERREHCGSSPGMKSYAANVPGVYDTVVVICRMYNHVIMSCWTLLLCHVSS